MSNYNSDSIDSLGILGGVREKPASIGLESHNHTFVEILANSIDEHREGYGDKIIITRHIDNSISIQDYGRSVPMDKNTKGEYAYNKVFNELWSGGKYNNNKKNKDGKKNYKYSLGTNGCGATGTNYCSDFLECTAIAPNNNQYYIRYEKGVRLSELSKSRHKEDYTGTLIHWLPSSECFRGLSVIEDDFIKSILQQQSIVNGNLRFIYNNEISNENTEYYYENGIKDYIKEVADGNNISDIISFSVETSGTEGNMKEEFDMLANLHFAFNNDATLMKHFHNSSYLENGGTPEDFIKTSFVYTIDKYIKDNNMYNKSESKVKFSDIQDSLIIISDTYSTISLYTDQVKKKIKSDFMNKYMTEYIKEKLNIYFIENKLEATNIINQILINKRANDKAEKTKLDIKSKLQQKTGKGLSQKIEGLKHCNFRKSKVEERILLLDEGLSANSTITSSFDNRIMGAYGLKGRFINSLKSSVTDVLNNIPAMGVISALGCGIEIPKEEKKKFKDMKTFNIDDLNYGKVGILCDADCWGKGINLSLLTFFKRFMPTLLKEGRIYLVISPRFEIELKDGTSEYAYNDEDKTQKINKIGENKVKAVTIRKGLGEFNKDEFYELVLSEEARKKAFVQVKYNENEELINEYFDKLMGENIDGRKQFIKDNIVNIDLSEVE